MKKITSIIRYVAQIFSAIAEGFDIASAKWPTNNPFHSANKENNG